MPAHFGILKGRKIHFLPPFCVWDRRDACPTPSRRTTPLGQAGRLSYAFLDRSAIPG
ncbi:MAG: hypothetical protein KME26_23070 [Oscillatoria princeps RMCB-10]|nr:hypothetical protein [Oscillatoria princeps RMCB-10]